MFISVEHVALPVPEALAARMLGLTRGTPHIIHIYRYIGRGIDRLIDVEFRVTP